MVKRFLVLLCVSFVLVGQVFGIKNEGLCILARGGQLDKLWSTLEKEKKKGSNLQVSEIVNEDGRPIIAESLPVTPEFPAVSIAQVLFNHGASPNVSWEDNPGSPRTFLGAFLDLYDEKLGVDEILDYYILLQYNGLETTSVTPEQKYIVEKLDDAWGNLKK